MKPIAIKYLLVIFVMVSFTQYLLSFNAENPIEESKTSMYLWTGKTARIRRKGQCGPYISVIEGGRLGNMMSEYATLVGFSKIYANHAPVISAKLHQTLSRTFPNITIPSLSEAKCKNITWNVAKPTKCLADCNHTLLDDATNYAIQRYVHQPMLFMDIHRQLIEKEFKFKAEIRDRADHVLQRIRARIHPGSDQVTFVGVHVRRTDYRRWLWKNMEGRFVSKLFFDVSFDHFRNNYENVVFVIATDDPKWSKAMFATTKDAQMTSSYIQPTPALDLAILSQCNHSVITYGTFSFWAAFLRTFDGGETLLPSGYATKIAISLETFSKIGPNWSEVQDPCYFTDKNGLVQVTEQCSSNAQLYGMY